MFIGEFQHNLDEKSRLAIPVKFRAELKEGAVVTHGLDNCLFVFSKNEWKRLAEKIVNLPVTQANSRAFSRFTLAGAMDVKLDRQGRIVLPEYLVKFAGIQKKVIVAGLYSRLEIWDEGKWNKYKSETESNSADIAEKMSSLGI
ncbi:MAG: division/cell wall cluster transcriptional repressor MraZ [Candidatus Magasanikbacteria bacterium]|nr:division/cell wall cluster transcriptional repressor MraZ [Candidatus Magasanikbacteria bacterium]